MKRLLTLTLAVALACAAAMAAPVDATTARAKAQQFLASKFYAGKTMAPGATTATLIKTEMGDNATTPVFYIFNTATTFVIVSGDDRALEVLAIGDKPLNLDRIPKNMEAWLNDYKQQLDWLLTHPDVKVDKPTTFRSPAVKDDATIGPLITALWDQTTPFNDMCHFDYNGTTYECYTGCPATSASMVLYYWKYPNTQVGPIPAYTSTLDLGGWNSFTYTYPALPAVTFDWDNMIDDYTSENATGYTPEQGAAVATLMRYVGQCEFMMYGTREAGGSGIYTTDTQVIADMFIGFGYDENTCRFVRKGNYTEAEWADLLQQEIAEHRPVVFCGVDTGGAGGHAFNVDGYDPSLNMYHVNFGWSGDGNNWYAMNAFSYSNYTFSENQRMIIGIQPPRGKIMPTPTTVNFGGFAGETYTQTVKVMARNIENNITLSISGSQDFSISETTITPEQAAAGHDITVTYSPTAAGTTQAEILLSCADEEVESVVVPVTGEAQPRVPTLIVSPESINMVAALEAVITKKISVTGAFLTNDITVTLSGNSNVFSVTPTTIPQSSTDVNTPVELEVSFSSPVEGDYSATITIASEGAQSKTVLLTANANDGGTASDPFLNIAKYETIDEAGWDTSVIRNLYQYTEHSDDNCAWLTVSNYGVIYADAQQEWFTNSGTRNGSNNWNATDIFLGHSSYFNGDGHYADWTEDYQSFYVTNCTQVKQLAYNQSSSYPLIMTIYECTRNADGTITPISTPVEQLQSSIYKAIEVLSSGELDEAKIYKVAVYNDFSHLYEIGFKTPLATLPSIVGDVNCDGQVTSVDITALYNYLLNGDTTYLATSDVNGDGQVTSVDITVIYNILLGE